jgi:hypothetical protein
VIDGWTEGIDMGQRHLLMRVKCETSRRGNSMQMKFRLLTIILACVALSACTSLLPRSSSRTPGSFTSFESAQDAVKRIVPLETRLSELKVLGFDPDGGANVTLIPYPDIVARLAPYPALPLPLLDPGVRKCVEDQAACRGFLFHFERQDRRRTGSFWLDFLNVRRTTEVTGWSFDALVIVSNGTVLFRNYAGQAQIDRVERQSNPLGPFQPVGEAAGAILRR